MKKKPLKIISQILTLKPIRILFAILKNFNNYNYGMKSWIKSMLNNIMLVVFYAFYFVKSYFLFIYY